VPETRDSLNDLQGLLIDTPSGSHVRLDQVADVRVAPALNVIKREGAQRRIGISAGIEGRSLNAVNQDVAAYLKTLKLPLEHHAQLVGDASERQVGNQRFLLIAIVVMISVFFLMQAALNSWRLAAIVLLSLPSALAGGMLAMLVGGSAIGFGTLAGLMLVFMVAVRNIILQIKHYQHRQWTMGEDFDAAMVRRGAGERFGPILATAVATLAAVLPWIVVGSIPGNEIMRHLAIVVAGGLVTSTLVSLLVIPTLYWHFGYCRQPELLDLDLRPEPQASI